MSYQKLLLTFLVVKVLLEYRYQLGFLSLRAFLKRYVNGLDLLLFSLIELDKQKTHLRDSSLWLLLLFLLLPIVFNSKSPLIQYLVKLFKHIMKMEPDYIVNTQAIIHPLKILCWMVKTDFIHCKVIMNSKQN